MKKQNLNKQERKQAKAMRDLKKGKRNQWNIKSSREA